MPVPYTRESIAALRAAARANIPAPEVLKRLGWDAPTLAARCKKHEIDIVVNAPMAAPIIDTPSPVPAPPDLTPILSRLTIRQAALFRFLHPHVGGKYFSATEIANYLGLSGPGSVIGSMDGLRRRLDRMDAEYQVESKMRRAGGYRLVVDEGAR